MNRQERQLSDSYLIRRLWRYLTESKAELFLVMTFMIAIIAIEVYVPLHVSYIIDDAILAGDEQHLILLSLIFLGLVGLFNLLRWIGISLFAKIGQKGVYSLRMDVFTKIQDHDQAYFDRTPTGETVSRLTNDISNMTGILNGQVIFTVLSIFQILGYLVIMLQRSVLLTAVSLIIVPLSIFNMWLNRKYIRSEVAVANREVGEVASSITENIQGARVSAAFSRAEKNTSEFEEINQRLGNTIFRLFRNVSFISPTNRLFSYTTLLLVIIVGNYLINQGDGTITVGILYLFITYTTNFAQPVQQISGVYNQIQNSFASFERVVLLIDEPTEVISLDDAEELMITDGVISLSNVHFTYPKSDEKVLEDFNLSIVGGETIAIVGHTGAGKSTITRLISRIYDIQKGRITIDDQDIREVSLESLRRKIGIVLQEPILFADTIRFNLTIGQEVPDNELFEVLDLVGAEFVRFLPNGLDTIVGERGSRLSLGQRQLISFARALVPDPPILFLDEATSSIDPQAELRIQKAMDEMLKNRTSIMIAHRLSTVKKADRIVVMANGKIIEQGSFDELLNLGGEFAELYQLQFKETSKAIA